MTRGQVPSVDGAQMLDYVTSAKRCEKCGAPARPLGHFPAIGPLNEIRIFRCTECDHVESVEILPKLEPDERQSEPG